MYTTTSVTNGNSAYLAANGMNQGYSYDAFGNMISSGNFNFQQAYTTANQLVGWNYDQSGNILIDANGNGYGWDAEGRATGIGQYVGNGNGSYTFNPYYTYVYDAEGERVSKTGSPQTDYINFGGRPIARLSGGQWTDLIYGVSGLLAEIPGTQTGAPVYRMLDHLGTQVGTLSSTGVELSSTDYAPFGQLFAGGTTDPYQFTGKERDTESGNDYFGARYYGSSMGRFMSPDWAAKASPVAYATFGDPQSLNLYSYMRNNPLGGVDADGHLPGGFAGPIILTPQQQYDIAVGAIKGFGRLIFSAFSMTDNRITNPAYAHMQDMPASLQYSNTTQAVAGTVAPRFSSVASIPK